MRLNTIYAKIQIIFALSLFISISAYAQPSNDNCDNPTLLNIGSDSTSCIPVRGDTRGAVDATMITNTPEVCSGSWYADDVWYSLETGEDPPEFGITVEVRLDSLSGSELTDHGLAIYLDCDATSTFIDCFSNMPGERKLSFPGICVSPNTNYLVRVWSAPFATENTGTFSICAYAAAEDTTTVVAEPQARIIYEETFDEGFNGWESVALTQSRNDITGEFEDDDWIWSETGCMLDWSNSLACFSELRTCKTNGIVGIPAGHYIAGMDGIPPGGIPPYDPVRSYLISPSIDLTKESCVYLTWIEAGRFLNGAEGLSELGPYVQYSLDNGKTWINPSQAIGTADVSENYGGEYVVNAIQTTELARSIPLLGAEGNSNVRIRFGFDGDFYYWMVDDIRIVGAAAADAAVQGDFFARSHINPMSIHMVDSYDFQIDIANLACEDLINLNANMTIVNSTGEEVHNVDLPYGVVVSDSLAQNASFFQPFTPDAVADDYTATYTVSADRDDDLSNNVRSFPFSVVDESQFRKEDGTATGQISPTLAFYENPAGADAEPFRWEVGNMFFAPNSTSVTGEPLAFNEISFLLANPQEIIDDALLVSVYKVEDADFDNIVSKEAGSTELTKLGEGVYTVTGLESELITVTLDPFGNSDALLLEPNTHYLASVENTTDVIRPVAMAIANDVSYDYSAALFNSQQNATTLEEMRYGNIFGISKENFLRIGPGNTDDLTTGNFAAINTPVVRLGFDVVPSDATVEINRDIEITISPNPTASDITVSLSIDQATDMEVSIVDISGRIIASRAFKNVTERREDFDLSNVASGVYILQVKTKDGVQTKKFVIAKK